ncbi:MAG: serine hydrolase domain-containing protein [Sphingomonadaceae bacterium]
MFDTRLDRRAMLTGGAGLLAFGATPAFARTALARRDAIGWSELGPFLDRFARDKELPGLAASVARGTDDAMFFNTGTLARGSARRVDPDSLFRIYSMTKPITGIAAMLLIEDGKLGLDQDIGDILPAFKNPRVLIDGTKNLESRPATGPITVRHLLTHTAGLGYTITTKGPLLDAYNAAGLVSGAISRRPIPGLPAVKPAPGLTAFADRLAALPLIADPGAKWSYSASLDLLGRVIEVASGMNLEAFFQSRLFDPLGMTSTAFRVPEASTARLTTNYAVTPLGRIAIDPGNDSVFSDPPAIVLGGAGLVSSPRDFDRFLAMLAGLGAIGRTRIMKAETARLAMSNLLPPGADTSGTFVDGQGFGAGGRVTLVSEPGGRGVGTFGWAGAAATIAWVDPTRGVRAAGYAQYVPDASLGFPVAFAKTVYASL